MGTPGRNAKPHLTKTILEMKFMKKTKDRLDKEMETKKDHSELYSNVISEEMKNAKGNFIVESSYGICEEFMEGRLSFKGMNPEIERLMELEKAEAEPQDEIIKDVSDEHIAKEFQKFKRNRTIDKNDSQFKNSHYRVKKRKFEDTT